ncbi:hypothetical protein [Microvirga yunnanensis]|uniref:hypothetical protein n=1 Tax=Microvirga yunnanensis TaxID=2953740 RepID=UPI0021C93262|nr:hypothetical protein [Microvirga sp. HBU65207]
MEPKLLKGFIVVPQQPAGFRRILSLPGHLFDQGDLLGHTPLSRGDVEIRLGEVFALFPGMGHDAADHAPERAHVPPIFGTLAVLMHEAADKGWRM